MPVASTVMTMSTGVITYVKGDVSITDIQKVSVYLEDDVFRAPDQ